MKVLSFRVNAPSPPIPPRSSPKFLWCSFTYFCVPNCNFGEKRTCTHFRHHKTTKIENTKIVPPNCTLFARISRAIDSPFFLHVFSDHTQHLNRTDIFILSCGVFYGLGNEKFHQKNRMEPFTRCL